MPTVRDMGTLNPPYKAQGTPQYWMKRAKEKHPDPDLTPEPGLEIPPIPEHKIPPISELAPESGYKNLPIPSHPGKLCPSPQTLYKLLVQFAASSHPRGHHPPGFFLPNNPLK